MKRYLAFALVVASAWLSLGLSAQTSEPGPVRYEIGTPTLQTIWVDPDRGDDRASGRSADQAVRTLGEAWRRVPVNSAATPWTASGYELRLRAGVYPASTIPLYMEARYGSPTAPVIIRAADGAGTVVLQAGLNVAHVAYLYLIDVDVVPEPAADVFHCEDCDHLLLRGVTFNGGQRPRDDDSEAPVAHETLKVNQSRHVYIEDARIGGAYDNALDFVGVQYGHIVRSRIHGAGDWCGYVKGGSAYLLVDSNEFFDCGTGGFTAGQGTGLQFMVDPWLHYEAYDVRVVNNVVHDTEGAGLGVNGGFNVLMAWNTLYRVGRRSHILEVAFGGRSCDAAEVAAERAACERFLDAGAWGTSAVDDGENFVRIPNRHVFVMNNVVFNPDGRASTWQHFFVPEAVEGASQAGGHAPNPSRADDGLRIEGNVIWNGPVDHPLGLGSEAGCAASHPTCGEPHVRGHNLMNSLQPAFADLDAGDVRPVDGLAAARGQTVPDFAWGDAPGRPNAPAGQSSNAVMLDRHGRRRGANDPPGAALPRQ